MDPESSREKDLFIDLESGRKSTIDEDERSINTGYSSSSSLDGPSNNIDSLTQKKLGGEEKVGFLDRSIGEKKPKKKRCRKPPKPPRPSKTSLDATDQKLVKELSELAMLKRARMDQMKALKNMKNVKEASYTSSLCALVITIIFCLVILWQGLFSGGNLGVSFQGSPESSVKAGHNYISVQFYRNFSSNSPQ